MGIINDFIAIGQAQKIKNGQVANLSISQITGLITNMSDARRNLSEKDFKQVYNLYKQFKKCNNKMKMDLNGYYETATYIIKKFDAIAPYEKYSGGNELEFSFLMEEIRNDSNKKDLCKDISKKEDLEYIDYILKNSMGMINKEDATDFMVVLHTYTDLGKEKALEEFDSVVNKIIKRSDPVMVISSVSYLLGILNSNQVINEEEMNCLGDKYEAIALDLMMKNNN